MIQRVRAYFRHRKMLRLWRSSPTNQIGTLLAIIENNPGVRKQFRQALRVRGYERD